MAREVGTNLLLLSGTGFSCPFLQHLKLFSADQLHFLCNTPSVVITANPLALISDTSVQWSNVLGQFLGSGFSFTATSIGIYYMIVTSDYGCKLVRKVVVSDCTGITSMTAAGVHCWPNPTSESITLAFEGATEKSFRILNSLGKVIRSGIVRSGDSINVANQAAGIYILETEAWRMRIVKE